MANNPSLRILHISDLHFTPLPHRETVWGKQKDRIPDADVMLADDVVKKFINNLKNFFKEEKLQKINDRNLSLSLEILLKEVVTLKNLIEQKVSY